MAGRSTRWRRGALLVLLVLAVSASVFYRGNPVVRHAEAYAGRVAAASGGTYVALRALNGFLSSVQEVEVGGSFVLAGSVQPLKVLEPVDDTVERVAAVIFAIMLVAGVCTVAMAPLSAVGMGMIALSLALTLLRPQELGKGGTGQGGFSGGARLATLASRLGWYGALLAIGLPLAFLLAAALEGLTAGALAEHRAVITQISAEVSAMEGASLEDDSDWSHWLGGLTGDAVRYREMAAQIISRTDEMVASFLAILGIYLFRMVLLPAVFLAAVVLVTRRG